MNPQQLINDHIDSQYADLAKIAKHKNKGITVILRSKHHYMNRVIKLYYLSVYAVKFNDGTDVKLANRSKWRKSFYINKLIN